MKEYSHITPLRTRMCAAVLVVGGTLGNPVHTMEFEFDDFVLDVDTTLGAAVQWRTESRDEALGAGDVAANFDDGNSNFDPGLISARGNLILEVGGQYKDFSFFVRGDALYDVVYVDNDTDISARNYLTYNGGIPVGGSLEQGEFPRETINEHGRRTRLLDAFVSFNFDLDTKILFHVSVFSGIGAWKESFTAMSCDHGRIIVVG